MLEQLLKRNNIKVPNPKAISTERLLSEKGGRKGIIPLNRSETLSNLSAYKKPG